MIRPINTGCVSNPKLLKRSDEFLTRVYPPNCKKVRICTAQQGQNKFKPLIKMRGKGKNY